MAGDVALVLGAGGHVGLAYHAGVLLSLEHHLGFDARNSSVIVGTSAGSIVASLLRLGLGAEDLAALVVGAPFREEWVHAEGTIRASSQHPHQRRLRNLVTPPTPGYLLGVARSLGPIEQLTARKGSLPQIPSGGP